MKKLIKIAFATLIIALIVSVGRLHLRPMR